MCLILLRDVMITFRCTLQVCCQLNMWLHLILSLTDLIFIFLFVEISSSYIVVYFRDGNESYFVTYDILEYNTVIWSPSLKCDVTAIEKVQKRGLQSADLDSEISVMPNSEVNST